ncbi:MAG: ABC transporter permease subunit [Verrucomicrobiaceae bacterium]|nr:ABC transporter permease subunit [Verrucomicrobiaceae bacterium]
MDAADGPDLRRGASGLGCVGTDYLGLPVVAAPVFSQPRGCVPKLDQRSCALVRQHLALFDFIAERLCAWCCCWSDQRHLHRLVQSGAVLGISNTRASYLDVARTLGAGRGYLIFRVAIPAALPSIFIGLFMGLGASFLTLVVAETVGVKSGLGWYVAWAQGWAEYGKVYAALVIMAAFFSTIMTLLFKVRDRVLVWQKGVIKW